MTTPHETVVDDDFGFHPKPHTRLRLRLAAAGYSPIPLGGKIPTMKGWPARYNATADEIILWQSMGFVQYQENTGLITRNTPAIDIDISEEEAAKAVEGLARERFGDLSRILVRLGHAPRRAILLRTDEPFAKLTSVFETPNGEKQAIEILGDGQQIAAFGIHPDTKRPYKWRGGEPGDVRAEKLPCVTRQDMLVFLAEAGELLAGQFGYKLKSGGGGRKPNGRPPDGTIGLSDPESLRADIDRVRKALKAIPNNDVSREYWIRIGLATAGATDCSEEGLAAWEEWSRKAPAYPDEEGCPRAWASFHPTKIGAGTLFDLAEEASPGWWSELLSGHKQESEDQQGSPDAGESTSADSNAASPAMSLEDVHSVFERYLGKEYDMATLDAVLAVTAAEKLGGDPAWLLVISGPGNAKTETVQSVSAVPDTHITSTIASEGALLSASPRKSHGKNATGGLLRKIGDRGILVIKDVTSILSMDRNVRSTVLAALREIHDGRWERNVGTDGGRTLSWEGRIVVIGACTTAWDQAHGVIASMGDRFVTIRSDSNTGRLAAGTRAIHNAGIEASMRKEMAEAVAGLIGHVDSGQDYSLTDDEIDDILHAANIVTLARTGVETDYRGDIIDAHAPEMPTRFAKQLSAVMRGGMAIGIPRDAALALALRCAKDSVPQLRLDVLKDMEANGESLVVDIRKRLQKPWRTVDRTLQALHALGLLLCREEGKPRGDKEVQVRNYQLAPSVVTDLQHLLEPQSGADL